MEPTNATIVTKKKLRELIHQIDPSEKVDADVEDVFDSLLYLLSLSLYYGLLFMSLAVDLAEFGRRLYPLRHKKRMSISQASAIGYFGSA